MTDPQATTRKIKFIELQMNAAHRLKDLRLHAPNHVRDILKYIHALERKVQS